MSSKRILIFSLAYYPVVGGAEVAIREITNRLRDIQFDMITMRFDKSHARFEAIGNVHVHRVGFGGSYFDKVLFVPMAVWKAWRLTRKEKYKKFWAMMTYMALPVSILRIFGNKTPYILTLQDGDPFERVFGRLRILLATPLLKYGFKNAEMIQTISNFLAEWPKRLGYKGRVEVIPNGVDVEFFTKPFTKSEIEEAERKIGKEEGDVILASSSRLAAKNGLEDVIKALSHLPNNIKFFNWGVGPDKQKLEGLSRRLGVEGRVKLFPHDPKELPLNFRVSDIFIRPSLSEGQGISFLEGMASGLPVIATPVGGIPDFISDPDKNPEKPPTGLFVKVKDPEGIARQVNRLIKNDRLKETLVANGKRLVKEKYDWNLIAGRMRKEVLEATQTQIVRT